MEAVGKFVAYLVLLAALAVSAAWYSQRRGIVQLRAGDHTQQAGDSWLTDLYSQNPHDAARASREVSQLGDRAVPVIAATLQNRSATRQRRKAALKACSILGVTAAPVIPQTATVLAEPELTVEAAVALSFMGREAFPALRASLQSDDPVVRRVALRSIGKLRFRAPLDGRDVLPLLTNAMEDSDEGVRAVAATYLGILHEDPSASIPLLVAGLEDADLDVRRASASALGSFGAAAQAAIPALRKASGDRDEDLAREAGRALVKLQSK
jgi:HEAT repeat protein